MQRDRPDMTYLDGGVTTGIQDFASVDTGDGSHFERSCACLGRAKREGLSGKCDSVSCGMKQRGECHGLQRERHQ
jgi:hypothetical protein